MPLQGARSRKTLGGFYDEQLCRSDPRNVALCGRVAQGKSASQAQMDRVNQKYTENGRTNSLRAAFDGTSGNLNFGFRTFPDNNEVRGFVTAGADVMNLYTIANEGRYRLTAVERIVFDATGKEVSKIAASQAQLDQLTEKFSAADGKLNTLSGVLNQAGNLEYQFETETGQRSKGTIPN